jgi:hypothetical protein
MLANLLQAAWLFGAIALLVYGGWLVLQFQRNASNANQHTVARLALNDSQPRNELLNEIKVAALGFAKQNGSLDSPRPQSGLTMATARSVRPNLEGSRQVLVVEDNLDAVHSTNSSGTEP